MSNKNKPEGKKKKDAYKVYSFVLNKKQEKKIEQGVKVLAKKLGVPEHALRSAYVRKAIDEFDHNNATSF